MVLTFKESAFFEGQLYHPGDTIVKPQGFTIPPVYVNAFHSEVTEEVKEGPKRRGGRKKAEEPKEDQFDLEDDQE